MPISATGMYIHSAVLQPVLVLFSQGLQLEIGVVVHVPLTQQLLVSVAVWYAPPIQFCPGWQDVPPNNEHV